MKTKKIIWWRFLALLLTFTGLSLLLELNLVKSIIILILISILSWCYKTNADNKEAKKGIIIGFIVGFLPLSVLLDGNIEAANIFAWTLLILFVFVNSIRHILLRQVREPILILNYLLSFFLLSEVGQPISSFLYALLLIIAGIILPYLIVGIGKVKRERLHYFRLARAIKRNRG